MGVAYGMEDTFVFPVWSPTVMDCYAFKPWQYAAFIHCFGTSLAAKVKISEFPVTSRVYPHGFFVHSGAGFIEVFQITVNGHLSDAFNSICDTIGTPFDHVVYNTGR